MFKIQISLFLLFLFLSGKYLHVCCAGVADDEEEGPATGVYHKHGKYELAPDEYPDAKPRVLHGDKDYKVHPGEWVTQLQKDLKPLADRQERLALLEKKLGKAIPPNLIYSMGSEDQYSDFVEWKKKQFTDDDEAQFESEVKDLETSYNAKIKSETDHHKKAHLKEELRKQITALVDKWIQRPLRGERQLPHVGWGGVGIGSLNMQHVYLKTLKDHLYHVTEKDRIMAKDPLHKSEKILAMEVEAKDRQAFKEELEKKASGVRKRRASGELQYHEHPAKRHRIEPSTDIAPPVKADADIHHPVKVDADIYHPVKVAAVKHFPVKVATGLRKPIQVGTAKQPAINAGAYIRPSLEVSAAA